MAPPLAPALAPYVASLVAYDVDLGAPGIHRGLPSTTLTFVLPVDEPLDVGWRGVPTSRGSRWSTVSGLHARPAEIHHDGHQRGVQLALTIAGARALLGVPAADLSGELLDLADVVPMLRHLPEQLAGEPAPVRWAALVQAALLAALARHGDHTPRAEVGQALARLTGGIGVHEVAEEVGYSRRHLTTLVRQECGIGPKEYQRVARLQRSRDVLVESARAGRVSLAEVAARAGYADQAHLTRDWSALAGCSPSTWLRTEFPFLQDIADTDAAG
jgi:AraC-like DNA-binding protein